MGIDCQESGNSTTTIEKKGNIRFKSSLEERNYS